MFTTPMIRLFAIVLQRDADNVARQLLRAGAMQFVNTSQVIGDAAGNFSAVESAESLAAVKNLRRRIDGFLHPFNIFPDTPKEIDLAAHAAVNLQESAGKLDALEESREQTRSRQRMMQQEILKLEDIKRQVALYKTDLSGIPRADEHAFISFTTGTLPERQVQNLENEIKDIPSAPLQIGKDGNTVLLLIIYMKRDKRRMEEILRKIGWHETDLVKNRRDATPDITAELADKLTHLHQQQKQLGDSLRDAIERESPWLKETWVHLRINELISRIQADFKQSPHTVIFSGWLPSSKKELLSKKINEACGDRCYLEWYDAAQGSGESTDAPVQLRNPKIFAPFQMLVANFGIPEYGAVDPTVFVMPLYLIMFGVMFADAGQGAILALLGYAGSLFYKKKNRESLVNLSHLILWCGCSSVFFGVLFGSYFGMGLIRPLWFDLHGVVAGAGDATSSVRTIYDLLKITLFFGVAVIVLGLLFNWLNLIRKREWLALFFDKGGIIGGWIYGSGVFLGWTMAAGNFAFPDSNLVFLLLGVPALLLLAGEVLQRRTARKDAGAPPLTAAGMITACAESLMHWSVGLLEIFSGYLSNTLSFMRVAGLGIAHVSLMASFFALADMAGGKTVAAAAILVAGNILVIVLEGLSAGIQALRLNYYEFFTKFFHGSGKLYSPVSLSSRDS